MRLISLLYGSLAAAALAAADLPPPPAASALKSAHVAYGQALYSQATAEIATRDAQLDQAADVRAEVLAWARGQAITQSMQFALSAAGDLTLTWAHDAQGEPVRYRIYRSGDGQAFAPIAEVAELSYVDRGLLVGATYWYFVTAYTPEAESGPSNTASAQAD